MTYYFITKYAVEINAWKFIWERTQTAEKSYKCYESSYENAHRREVIQMFWKFIWEHWWEIIYVLEVHMRTHTAVKSYKWSESSCENTLDRSHVNLLKVHMRMLTGEKSYKCFESSYENTHEGSHTHVLKVHMKSNMAKIPFAEKSCVFMPPLICNYMVGINYVCGVAVTAVSWKTSLPSLVMLYILDITLLEVMNWVKFIWIQYWNSMYTLALIQNVNRYILNSRK